MEVYRTGPRGYRLAGELDLSSLDRLAPIEKELSSPGDLRLDLTRLAFIDGAGLERIRDFARSLERSGSYRLVVLRPQRSIERLLKRLTAVERIENLVISRLQTSIDDSFESPEPERDLSRIIASDYPPEAIGALIVDLAVSEVDGAESGALAVTRGRELVCATSSARTAHAVQEMQISMGEGPAVDAVRLGSRQHTNSLVTEPRWPAFTNKALYSGFASVISEPMLVRRSPIGALSLFSSQEQAFGEDSLSRAAELASRGAVAMANSLLYWHKGDLVDQLREALDSRAVIDQAKGILMAREGLTAEEAFTTLLRASQRGNSKVREIAQRLVLETQVIGAERPAG